MTHTAEKDAHGATLHGDRVVCTCGDFDCASLEVTRVIPPSKDGTP